ncbi:G protein-coupled receptor [Caenorhabditis elegans]|uniref:G protein-coupled receptor n=1 Tax=Caenorhabditis elegans TaxID=6239 RepID=P92019_CAEEL|nr:G protein-coupled receptor [Caenorhabditis elegans]CAB03325.1 G protein-coupled receptor [Caenorhabditis elegans]|eukprot:NP_506344.1 Uncharacterized protein CELE_T10G3.2 [Caenorhabditis elegans]
MNRSWEEIFMENCGSERLFLLSIASSVALVPLSSLFFSASVAFYRKRKIFHPMFSFCFFSLLLLYYSSTTFLAIRNITFSFYGENYGKAPRIADHVVINCERFYMAISYFIPPLIAIGIIERIFATAFSRFYEKSRYWMTLGYALVFACILVYIEFANRHVMMATIPTRNIQVLFAIICSWSLILLLFINRSKSKSGRAKSALSERYQVNENLKALRIHIPVVCVDTGIQIMFLCSDIFWNTAQVLNLNYCYDDNIYLHKFVVFRLIGFILQYFIPFIILHRFSQMCCNSLRRRPVRRSHPISPSPGTSPSSVVTIQNVFGMTLSGEANGPAGQEAHFKNLYAQWN